jgi:hypothetical protein
MMRTNPLGRSEIRSPGCGSYDAGTSHYNQLCFQAVLIEEFLFLGHREWQRTTVHGSRSNNDFSGAARGPCLRNPKKEHQQNLEGVSQLDPVRPPFSRSSKTGFDHLHASQPFIVYTASVNREEETWISNFSVDKTGRMDKYTELNLAKNTSKFIDRHRVTCGGPFTKGQTLKRGRMA